MVGVLGCVKMVRMYWKEGGRETTPLYHMSHVLH